MFNLKKISKIWMFAGALAFASFLPSDILAAGDNDYSTGAFLSDDGSLPSENYVPQREAPLAPGKSLDGTEGKFQLAPVNTGSITRTEPTTAEKAGASKDVWAVEQQKYEQANQAYKEKLAAANKEIAVARQKCNQTGNCNDLDVAQEKYATLQATEGREVDNLRTAAQTAEKEADQLNKQANKELIKAENQNAKDIKNAQKAADKAQNNINKYCSGTSEKDMAKCQEAKTSFELASQELKAAQDKQGQLAGQRAATQQADIDGINEQSRKEMAEAKKSQYSATAEEANASKENYNAKKNAVSEAQAKLNEDKARCANGDQDACGRSVENEKAVEDAKKEAQTAYDEMQEKTRNPAPDELTSAKDNLAASEAKVATAEEKVSTLQSQLDAANKACTQASALTSKAGQKQAEQFCGQAAQLEQQLQVAQNDLIMAQSEAAVAKNDLNIAQLDSGYESDHRGQEYRAFATEAQYAGQTGTDVFRHITRRAFIFLVGIKPLVYTFAGFGLIAFAWMAVFNKLSWKWFGNIAIGLFLVANMGRFIEYFVFPSYDIEGDISSKPLSYGDYLSPGFADTEYMWVDASAEFVPEKQVGEEEIPSADAPTPEYKEKARGFCGKTAGATGWANFTSCVKDIVSTGKKAVDTVKTAQNTINNVKAGVEQVKAAARNIGDAAGNIKGGGVSGFIKAVGQIGSNASAMVNVTGGVVNSTMSNVSRAANNIQDLGKSTDQVAELNEKRSQGQGTNAVDRFMKGQTKDADGNVEQLIKTDKNGNPIVDKDGNLVMGNYASDRNFATGLKDTTEKVVEKNRDLNSKLQSVTKTAYEGAVAVENFDLQTKGFKTIAERRMEKNDARARAKIEARNESQRQKEQAKTKEIQDQRLVDKFKQETAASTSQTNVAKQAWEEAQKASEKAQDAAQDAERRQYEAAAAETNYNKKNSAATTAETNAKLLEEKASQTGNAYDKQVAERARKQADIARAEANAAQAKMDTAKKTADEAKQKAEELAKPVSDLTEKARAEAAKEAARVAEEAKKQANADLSTAQNEVNEKAQAAQKAQQEAEKALADAKASNSVEDIRKAEEAKKRAQEAADARKAAQQKYENAVKLQKEAAEKAAQAELFKTKVENGGYLITADEKKQQEADKKADELRQQYQQTANPVKQAQYTQEKAERADKEARSAEAAAESARKQADELKAQASAAAAQAAGSKNPVDQRRAEQLKNQASLAEKQAKEAESKVITAKAPAIKAANAAREAALIEAQYKQDTAQKQMTEYETGIQTAKDKAKELNTAYLAAQAEAQRLAQIAAGDRDTASVLAANEAAQKARAAQEAARKAQQEIDNQIRARNQAEQTYYAERTRQAELEQQKTADRKALEDYLKTLSPSDQEELKKLLAEGSNN